MPTTLHDPTIERDACGIGLVADARGRASRELVDRALAGLAAVSHRGAWAADGVRGRCRAAPAVARVPDRRARRGRRDVLPARALAEAPSRRRAARRASSPSAGATSRSTSPRSARPRRRACRGSRSSCWRLVPHRTRSSARTAPAAGRSAWTASTWRRSRSARSRTRRSAPRRSFGASTPTSPTRAGRLRGRSSTSASRRTPRRAGSARSRSGSSATTARSTRSTATSSGWRRGSAREARPRSRAGARSHRVGLGAPRQRARAPRQERPRRPRGAQPARPAGLAERPARARRAARDAPYHAMLAEPWDGPAGLVFSDGVVCGAALDRNGLRPLRIAVCDDGLVAVSSEAGAVPLPDGAIVRRGRLGPGQLLSVDPERGLLFDGELKRDLASRKPYGAWVEEASASATRVPRCRRPGRPRRAHALHGYTREELSLMLRPIAQTGATPSTRWATTRRSRRSPVAPAARRVVLPAAVRAGDEPRDRPLPGALGDVDRHARRPARADRRRRPAGGARSAAVVSRHSRRPQALEPVSVDATFTAGEGLAVAVDRVADECVSLAASGATALCLTDAAAGGERATIRRC